MTDGGTLALGRRAEPSASKGLLAATMADLRLRSLSGPPWLMERRAEAERFLSASGFPRPTDEAWRLTPLHGVLRVPYSRSTSANDEPDIEREHGPRIAGQRAAIVNGVPVLDRAWAGAEPAPGIEVRRIADVLASDPGRLEPYLGRLAVSDHGFVAQNTCFFDDGLVVVARSTGRSETLHLVHLGAPSASPTLGTPRVLVVAEPGSDMSLVESHLVRGEGLYLESAVTEVFVGAGARVEHVRVQHGSERGASTETIAVRQSAGSRYVSRVFTFGGSLSRLDLRVELAEEGAECALDGLYLARSGDIVDHHTVIQHESPRCSSHERYKGIVDGSGLAVFDGTVIVRRGAARTEAHQENRNLLLSNDAVVHTKPHLEIDTDDVKCSHGATVGRLDPAQLFYLRSRGMDADVARSLLTYAFAREMAAKVTPDDLRLSLEDIIAAFLPAGRAAKELA